MARGVKVTPYNMCFALPENFKQELRARPAPKWGYNGLGAYVFARFYSRLKPDGTKETFADTVIRCVESTFSIMVHEHGGIIPTGLQDEAKNCAHYMFTMRFMPTGRILWASGTELLFQKGGACLASNGFVSTKNDLARPLAQFMEFSMYGCVMSIDTRYRGMVKRPGAEAATYHVPDSREGWADSVFILVEAYTGVTSGHLLQSDEAWTPHHRGKMPIFNYGAIRAQGALVNGTGCMAAGPLALQRLHQDMNTFFEKFLEFRESYGVMRVTQESLAKPDDYNYVRLVADLAHAVETALATKLRQQRCLPTWTPVLMADGSIRRLNEITVGEVVMSGQGPAPVTNVWRNDAPKALVRVHHTSGFLDCSPDHKLWLSGAYVCARDVKIGDRLTSFAHLEPSAEWVPTKPESFLLGLLAANPVTGQILILPGWIDIKIVLDVLGCEFVRDMQEYAEYGRTHFAVHLTRIVPEANHTIDARSYLRGCFFVSTTVRMDLPETACYIAAVAHAEGYECTVDASERKYRVTFQQHRTPAAFPEVLGVRSLDGLHATMDLEVQDAHNFFAAGILVSNSQILGDAANETAAGISNVLLTSGNLQRLKPQRNMAILPAGFSEVPRKSVV